MTANATVGGAQKISNSEGGFAAHYTLSAYDHFGSSVASIDLNSDGVSELVVGAPGGSYSSNDYTGAVYVLFLSTSGAAVTVQKISNSDGGLSAHYTPGSDDGFGTSVAPLGDMNGDKFLDLVIANACNGPCHANQLLLGDGNGTFDLQAELPGDSNNSTTVALGDVNGDGSISATELEIVLGTGLDTLHVL